MVRWFGIWLVVLGTERMGGVKTVELNEAAAGRAVRLVMGERVRMTLRESGGTGYRWRVGMECGPMLHLEEEKAGAASGVPGAGRERMWVFMATGVGRCELRFESVRAWEKGAVGKVVSFPVTVHG